MGVSLSVLLRGASFCARLSDDLAAMWRLELGTPKTGQTAFAIWPVVFRGAGDGNRTRVMSLEGSGSTIEPRPHVMHTLAQAGGVRRALRKSAARRKCRKRGRDDRIRTCDVLPPKQARYQTAPRPDLMRHELYRNGTPSNPAPEPRPGPKALKAHGALGRGRTQKDAEGCGKPSASGKRREPPVSHAGKESRSKQCAFGADTAPQGAGRPRSADQSAHAGSAPAPHATRRRSRAARRRRRAQCFPRRCGARGRTCPR